MMVALGHTAVGVIVGVTGFQLFDQTDLIGGLAITGPSRVISYYLGDFIPHGHFVGPDKIKQNLLPIIIFDLLLPIVLLLGAVYLRVGFSDKLLFVLFGIGGAHLPDVLDGLLMINLIKAKGIIKMENDFHQALHWHGTGSKTLLLGIRDIWQIIMVFLAWYMI